MLKYSKIFSLERLIMLKRLCNLLIIFIICIVPLIIIPWRVDYYYFPKAKAIHLASIPLLIILIIFIKKWIYKVEIQDFLVLLYLALIIFSTLVSIDFTRSLHGRPLRWEGLITLGCYIVIFLGASKYYTFSYRHVYILLFSISLIAVYGIAQYFGFDPIPQDSIRVDWKDFAFGTTGNPNFLGSLLTLALPITSGCYIYTRKKIHLIASALFFTALLCSETRGAWIGTFMAGLMLIVFLIINKVNLKPLFTLLLIFTIIIFGLNRYNNFETRARFTSIIDDARSVAEKAPEYEKAGSTRIFVWKKTLMLIKSKPLTGYGPDTLDIPFMKNFRSEVNKYYGNMVVDKAHNEYLQIAVTIGIPGLLVYLLFILSVFIKALKTHRGNPIVIILLCSTLGYWIQAFFNISVVSVAPVYWGLMGILMSQTKGKRKAVTLYKE
jgi:O-antigen ligase